MAISPRELRRLMLQIERDLVAQSHLRKMLNVAGVTLRDHRQTLRNLITGIGRSGRMHTAATAHARHRPKSGTV